MQAFLVLACILSPMLEVRGRGMLSLPTDADVVVIGAGMAGAASAANLSAAGAKVIVLEARDRSGGRLFSAQSVHGESQLTRVTALEPLGVLLPTQE
jgi:NADPH-dependent 2,4-dienoyl-CoA reductase/sulfur reductase-like enzyme